MGRLVYSMGVSLDGFINGPGGDLDWIVVDEEFHRWANEVERNTAVSLYGRRMWEAMAGYWPTADQDATLPDYVAEFAPIWRATRKVVVSRTLDSVDWNARLVRDDVEAEIRRLKADVDGDIAVSGPTLAAVPLRAGLVDEVGMIVQPVVLGGGTPMFPPDVRLDLRLIESLTFGSGVVLLRYERRG